MASRKTKEPPKGINSAEFFKAIEELAREKSIPAEFFYEKIAEAIAKATKNADSEKLRENEAKRRADIKQRKALRLQKMQQANGDKAIEEELYAEEDADNLTPDQIAGIKIRLESELKKRQKERYARSFSEETESMSDAEFDKFLKEIEDEDAADIALTDCFLVALRTDTKSKALADSIRFEIVPDIDGELPVREIFDENGAPQIVRDEEGMRKTIKVYRRYKIVKEKTGARYHITPEEAERDFKKIFKKKDIVVNNVIEIEVPVPASLKEIYALDVQSFLVPKFEKETEETADGEKDLGKESIRCQIDPESKTIRLFRKYAVIDDSTDTLKYSLYKMTVSEVEACKGDDTRVYLPGDIFEKEIPVPEETLGRVFAENVKSNIVQAIKERVKADKDKTIIQRDGKVVRARVISAEINGNATVEIDGSHFIIKKEDLLPSDKLKPNTVIDVFVESESIEDGKHYANLSRRDIGLIKGLFEREIIEISEHKVEIITISRDPGSKTKIAVASTDPKIPAVGSCIGTDGSRIKSIVKLLGGEQIEVIEYSDIPEKYIASALKPANVTSVTIDESTGAKNKKCTVVVPNKELSLAIGNKGQNVRLAARLTGYKIDIKVEDDRFGLLNN